MLIKDLRISPLRTFLTGFSMFVGIVAVILSVLSGTVGRTYLEATNEQLYGRKPTVSALINELEDASHLKLEKLNKVLAEKYNHYTFALTPEDSYMVGLVKNQNAIGTNTQSALREASAAGTVDALYVSPTYNEVFNLPMTSGRWFLPDEDARFEAVINKAAQANSQGATGAIISTANSINTSLLRVVGVVNDGVDIPRVYINAISASHYLHDTWKSTQLSIYVWNVNHLSIDSLRTGISDAVADSTQGQLSEVSNSQASSAFDEVASAIQIAFGISAALLLFVSSIGLINIGLASLEQRSRELLIRRALGATRGSIAFLVLGGSLLLAVIVTLLAVLLAALIVYSVPLFLPPDTPISPPAFPFSAAYISITAGIITAIAGSLVPAIRAARLQPALALR